METNEKPRRAKPVYEARVGQCRAAVWENKTKDGKTHYSVQPSRRYSRHRDGKTEWRTSNSFSVLDRPLLQQALDEAFEFAAATVKPLSEQLAEERVAGPDGDEQPAEEADEADRVASI